MNILLSLSFVLMSLSGHARPALDLTQEVIVETNSPDFKGDLKQEAFKKAVEAASLKLITDTIGAEAVERGQSKVKQITDKSEKYILFIKSGTTEPAPEGTRVKVDMKVSLDNLESLLREAGLVQDSTRGFRLLPLVRWTDESGKSFSWWTTNTNTSTWSKFVGLFSAKLKARGVRLPPELTADKLPANLKKPVLSRAEQIELAKIFDAALVFTGEVAFERPGGVSRAKVDAELVQVRGDRSLGSRVDTLTFKPSDNTLSKVAENLAERIKLAQGSGRMNTGTLLITVEGHPAYQDLANFQKQLLEQVLDLRSLKQRLLAPERIVLIGESNKPAAELAGQIERAKFSGFKVDAHEESGGISVRLRPL